MKAMTSFTLKSLKASTARTVVTIAGVALAAALLVAVLSSYVSATDYLLRNEIAMNGTWTTQVVLPDDEESHRHIAAAESADDVNALATLQDVGVAELTPVQATTLGHYLPILTGTGPLGEVCALDVDEGRMAENPTEIVLPGIWKHHGDVTVGDVITLDVGMRRAVLAPGKEGTMSGGSAPADYDPELTPQVTTYEIEDGSPLNSTMGYLEAEADGGIFNEEFVSGSTRSYTVVGFNDDYGWGLMTGIGPAAITVGDAEASGDIQVYLDIAGITSTTQLKEIMDGLFGDVGYMVHDNLLRYRGITNHGGIWQTLFYLVAILAVIIMAACISLIYNAFAISVNERMRQFGLLASIGASKRQLRRSVLLEGSIIAAIGIPLGILIGLGACAVIFAWLSAAIANILGGMQSSFYLVVSWQVVLFAIVLTALTVLVSVWIPALRAARVSPIDALRQSSTIKFSRRALRAAGQHSRQARPWRKRGIAGKAFGIGGTLASLNHKRNASKGRAASLSLALAIVLLMTAGSLSTQIGMFTKVAGNLSDADVSVNVSLKPDDAAAATPASIEAACIDVYERASAVEGVTPRGWALNAVQPGLVPASVAGSALHGSVTQSSLVDGDVPTLLSVVYMPDDEFTNYAKDSGIELPASSDAPIAIGVREGYGNTGTMYTYDELFASTGTLDVVTGMKGDNESALSLTTMNTAEDGREQLEFVLVEGDDIAERMIPASELVRTPVNVIGLADEAPTCATRGNGATIVMPLSAADTLPLMSASGSMFFSAAFDADDAQTVIDPLKRITADFEDSGYTIHYNQVSDNHEAEESMRMTVTVVNVFCFLFSFILTLIALANVFNTVTNGLILRKREFAVMESIGMDTRQFRSMIGCECIGYGMRGLIPGIIVSVIVSYLLYLALSVSMRGLPFTLPWGYLALGCGVVVVVMALSVFYGLHRCRKGNVVEALRME